MTSDGAQSASRVRFIQLIRFGIVGVLTNLGGYLLYLGITGAGVGPKTTMSVLYLVGASVGFITNRRWTFAHRGNAGSSFVRYWIAHGFGYFLNLVLLSVFADRLGYPHQWVQAGAVIAVALFLFFSFRVFVFPERQDAQ